MALSIENLLDIGIISGGVIGLIGIFFPEFLYKFANPTSEIPYNKKNAWKYRLGGLIIVLIGIAFYVYDNYFY